MTVSMLEEIKKYYEQNILSSFKLRVPADKNIYEYGLVTPACHIGWVPPKGIIEKGDEVTIPCVVISVDKKTSSNEFTLLELRLSVAVYEPSTTGGFNVLLNLMDRLEAQTLKNRVIADSYELVSDIECAMYEEQPYPYWYGYLKFKVQVQNYPVTRYADFL